jgi:uncharacterized protein (TIGR02145 family)
MPLNVDKISTGSLSVNGTDITGNGGISVNGISTQNIQIGPTSLVTVTNPNPFLSLITLKPEIPYKAYRAKLTAGEIDWPGYGFLYNWFAVDDVRKLENPDGGTGLVAPNQWRVPSNTDWDTLITFAGGSSVADGKLKSNLDGDPPVYYGWVNNGGGTDDYNFSGLPGGFRYDFGLFNSIGILGYWWSSSEYYTNNAWVCYLNHYNGNADREANTKRNGFSVRCLRD